MTKSLKVIIRITDRCNQDCQYCYVDRETRRVSTIQLDLGVIRRFYKRFFGGAYDHIHIVWHGGEPTLVGARYLQDVLDSQADFVKEGVEIENSIQTNATAMTPQIAELLKTRKVGVGVSIDAPPDVHDLLRINWSGRSTLSRVLENVQMMRNNGLSFGAICVLHKQNYQRVDEIYRFFKELGMNFQFNPLYRDEATPMKIADQLAITPEEYAEALCAALDLFVEDPDPTIEVSDLKEIVMSMFMGCSRSCLYAGKCEEYIGVLPDGDVYFCDVFFRKEYRLGNIATLIPEDIHTSPVLHTIVSRPGRLQATYCQGCEWWNICRGGCTSKAIAIYGDAFREDPFCLSRKLLFSRIQSTLGALARKEVINNVESNERSREPGSVCAK